MAAGVMVARGLEVQEVLSLWWVTDVVVARATSCRTTAGGVSITLLLEFSLLRSSNC